MKYKINRNRPPLTDSDITQERNFYKVLRKYNGLKIPFYKSGRFLASSSAIVVAACVALIVLFDSTDEVKSKGFIAPPFAQAVIATDSFIVEADKGAEIDYKSGSKIYIPANAFKDKSGKIIQGKVTLRYREFHDQKDIFLSGIPMTYDSAGQTYIFESAGMMEITAWQNSEAVVANQDKPIQVDMVSNTQEDKYNTYYLDTTAKKWVNINQANISTSADTNDVTANANHETPELKKCEKEMKKGEAAVEAIKKDKPTPIAKVDLEKPTFRIVIDSAEFPEIAMYKNVKFQIKDESTFDKEKAKIQWDDVKLKKIKSMDYEVVFTKGKNTFSVVGTPVVEAKDMAAAKKIYDRKFADYQSKLAVRIAEEAKAKKEYEAQIQKAQAEQKEMELKYEARMTKTQLIYRTFSINRFGTYNCDRSNNWPSEADVVANLTDEHGDKLHVYRLNLVEKGINAIFPYPVGNGECLHFKFSSSRDNMLWAVTTDNKLAIVDVNSFKSQQARYGKVQFRFKVIDKDFKNSDEVKKYLEI